MGVGGGLGAGSVCVCVWGGGGGTEGTQGPHFKFDPIPLSLSVSHIIDTSHSPLSILRLQMIHSYYPYYLSLLKEPHDFNMSQCGMES